MVSDLEAALRWVEGSIGLTPSQWRDFGPAALWALAADDHNDCCGCFGCAVLSRLVAAPKRALR